MILSDMLQELTAQIMDDTLLSESQQKEKIIQVFDLYHFIETLKLPLKIIDYSHKINVVEDDVQKGIYFCDVLYNIKKSFDKSLYTYCRLESIKYKLKIKELWFVVVEESYYNDELTMSKEFIKNNQVESLYDKIFYFNFSTSTIKILK